MSTENKRTVTDRMVAVHSQQLRMTSILMYEEVPISCIERQFLLPSSIIFCLVTCTRGELAKVRIFISLHESTSFGKKIDLTTPISEAGFLLLLVHFVWLLRI